MEEFDAMGSAEDLQHAEEELAELHARLEALVEELEADMDIAQDFLTQYAQRERFNIAQKLRVILAGKE